MKQHVVDEHMRDDHKFGTLRSRRYGDVATAQAVELDQVDEVQLPHGSRGNEEEDEARIGVELDSNGQRHEEEDQLPHHC